MSPGESAWPCRGPTFRSIGPVCFPTPTSGGRLRDRNAEYLVRTLSRFEDVEGILKVTVALREELPDFIKTGIICPGFVQS